jgi:hypothetical protein
VLEDVLNKLPNKLRPNVPPFIIIYNYIFIQLINVMLLILIFFIN